jgi:glycyl-tRNA synthetase
MEAVFNTNGLVFWSEREVRLRETARDFFAAGLTAALIDMNPAWRVLMVEAPLLTPRELLNVNYTEEDIWLQGAHDDTDSRLALRPETTPGTYAYMQYLLGHHTGVKPPFCVWQAGKSFRREQEQPSKHMRLKEFYQQEFQCLYTADTANDYHAAILEPMRKMIADFIMLPTRIVESDRLPSYSQVTMDVEVDNGDKWMEVCSISRRTDFPQKLTFTGKKGVVEKDALVLEVAIGLDRVVYNWQEARNERRSDDN